MGALLPILALVFAGLVPPAHANGLAVIKGVVRADGGSPISDATVAIFLAGTATLLKQVQSAADGSFLARVAPGRYTVLAVAEGFNPVTLSDVEVLRSAQLVYGFKLERAGSGNTLPEKRVDRNNPKWARRAATISRSIYQNVEGEEPGVAATGEEQPENDPGRKSQTVSESYFASSDEGSYVGFNFATFMPVTENAELVLAAQAGVGAGSPQRVEMQAKFRPSDDHHIRLNTSFGKLATLTTDTSKETLSQFNLSATDEWKVREGLILVYGFDFSRFAGAGGDSVLSPRLGVQYDVDSKTRARAAFTTQTEDKDWSRAIALEDAHVIFREPVAVDDIYLEDGKPVMNRTSRFEVGFERVLDSRSSIDANVFADATFSRGVGFAVLPFAGAGLGSEFTGSQRGETQGISLVYNRRISGGISTAAGYSLGRGQRLSARGISNAAELFENGFFQTFFGQIDAELRATGTNVKTVFRLSPDATVFAIDPFQGRLAIYDPSLSVLVTQNLPNLGLPFHAQAVVDARNLFDLGTGVTGEEGTLRLTGQGRTLRGGILVRF